MGVHGLWELLAPVGRRVSVENLSGKRLAIDASIWMVQFMKAMRDENGEMVRNAHLLGFFRRICKLLFLRTKPVFVFDGATPALKRRTVLARRRQRENAQAKIRKTAERLLLNHIKDVNLKRLAEDLKNQKADDGGKGKGIMVNGMDNNQGNTTNSNSVSASYDQEKLDEMLAASLAAEDDGTFTGEASASASAARVSLEEENDADEEMEELVLPTMQGDVDPNVLSSLPPSVQLDLLSQMRERLMAENRQKYQKVKKAPEKFSALQIQSYLKTVAFRREIDEVQKSAGNMGVGGVQTSRIASETSREFIFSSSFAGNRETLTFNRMENIIGDKEKELSAPRSYLALASQKRTHSKNGSGSGMNQSGDDSHGNVETYLDDSGRVHVSRVRALGIRMTRDLQRNLDMMKEMEQEKSYVEATGKLDCGSASQNVSTWSDRPSISLTKASSDNEPVIDHSIGNIGHSTPAEKISFQISFDEYNCHDYDDDDEIFRGLVAGKPRVNTEVGNASLTEQSNASDSDIEWEEETIEGNPDGKYANEAQMNCEPLTDDGTVNDEGGVDWEDGVIEVAQEAAFNSAVCPKAASRGVLEEESQLQEAIKRSLDDAQAASLLENVSLKTKPASSVNEVAQITHDKNEVPKCNLLQQKVQKEVSASCEILDDGSKDIVGERSAIPTATARLSATMEYQVHKNNIDQATLDTDPMEDHCDVGGNTVHDIPGLISNAPENKESYLAVELEHDSVKSAPEFSEYLNVSFAPSGVLPPQVKENSMAMDFDTGFHEGPELDINKRESLNRSGVFELDAIQREELEASLVDELSVLDKERVDLGNEQKKLERNAEAVSGEMFAECQELLQMFGLPYIIAPMEAEAQCAFLEQAGLVDGVVTDDSDVFLFGAKNVYKNIFDNRKYVETYFMKDIEHELGLSRGKLIRIAMLLGSDYTEGISGIGIVNAIEVLNAFPEEDGLRKFRDWIESPDPTIFYKERDTNVNKKGSSSRKKDVALKKKRLGKNGNGLSCAGKSLDLDESGNIDKAAVDDVQELKQTFKDKHRNVSKNWHIPSSFPSDAVISAYTSPKVDLSTEPFSHGRPDHPVLRRFCLERFGWNYQKSDELLLPVLKEYNKHETQLRLEAFYTFNEKFAKIRSKRIKRAVKGITGKNSLDNMHIVSESDSGYDSRNLEPAGSEGNIEGGSMNNEVSVHVRKSQKKMQRKRKTCTESASTEKVKDGPRADGMHNISKASSRADRARQRVPAVKKLNRKQGKLSDSADICAGETSKEKKPLDILEKPPKLIRTTRTREAVKYTSDVEVDNMDMPSQNFEGSLAKGEQGNLASPLYPLHPNQRADQNSSPSALSGDYLKIGGGFCVDGEDEVSDES